MSEIFSGFLTCLIVAAFFGCIVGALASTVFALRHGQTEDDDVGGAPEGDLSRLDLQAIETLSRVERL